jgi:hypothetical protein
MAYKMPSVGASTASVQLRQEREPSARDIADQELTDLICEIHAA